MKKIAVGHTDLGNEVSASESTTVVLDPRSLFPMRPLLALIGGPFLMASAVVIALAFPTPADLAQLISPAEPAISVVNAGGTNAQTIVTDLAQDLPQQAAATTADNGECFANLALADDQKLDRCAQVVYQALIEVEKATQAGYVRDTIQNPNRGRAVEQLRFAAVEVCRNQWATSGSSLKLKNTKACQAAEIKVASDAD